MSTKPPHNLLIFPGTGDPSSLLYEKVYGLIELLAVAEGYSSVDRSVRWPGHQSSGISGTLSVAAAAETARALIRRYEESAQSYDILARSFGCFVALLAMEQSKVNNCRRIVLWGPPPYWKLWELWVRDIALNATKGTEKGVLFDGSLFSSVVPIESLLPRVQRRTTVAYGTRDRFFPISFVAYLRALSSDNPLVENFCPVAEADHEVTETDGDQVVQAYKRALFQDPRTT
jgi:pimeloyl-ACP methyl ester carboxylesterase